MKTDTAPSAPLDSHKQESDNDHDSETTSQISSTLLDVTNLVSENKQLLFILSILS